RALLARYRQERVGATGSQRPQQPGHDQYEVISARKIEERIKGFNRSALLRLRQRQHARWSAEAHWRASDHAPSIGSDVDGAPLLISEIEIDVAIMLGDADVNGTLQTVELRPRLE